MQNPSQPSVPRVTVEFPTVTPPGNRPQWPLLDSCAAVSIVPPSFAPTNIQQSTEQLSMASGHNILGALKLLLTIRTWSTQHHFCVAPIATNPILRAIDLLVSRRQLRLPSGFSHPLIAPPPPSLLPASPDSFRDREYKLLATIYDIKSMSSEVLLRIVNDRFA